MDVRLIPYRMAVGCEALIPKRKHEDDAGYDLRTRDSGIIEPGKVKLLNTGLFVEVPKGFELQVRPRSGLALNDYVGILNSPGTIDAGYRGEVGVIMFNFGEKEFKYDFGDRIAQGVYCALPVVRMVMVRELSASDRGADGFGSTGVK
jgi:dUTP pyrophosphatase